jgi:hypothetical protein
MTTLTVLAALLGHAQAASETVKITVKAGEHDRANTPLRALVTVPEALADVEVAALTDGDGTTIVGQLTGLGILTQADEPKANRELHFVLPKLAKGKSVTLTATISTDAPKVGKTFSWHHEENEYAELRYGDRPVIRYMCKPFDPQNRVETYKVFHHLYNPEGTAIITKGPGGRYTHHRGLFFGFRKCAYEDGSVDTWHCSGDTHLTHEGFLSEEAGPVVGRHRVAVDWHGKQKKVFGKEKRQMAVYALPGGTLVEFATRLSSTVGKVKLDGDPQHAGFQFRASNEVAAKTSKQTYYVREDGIGKPGKTRNWPGDKRQKDRRWNAMSFVVGGERYTAVYLDHPDNPKPGLYSERPYGRFGSYFVTEINDDKDLLANYRIWLQDGEKTVEECEALRANFADPPEVTVEQ